MYHRFALSIADVEDLLAERGIVVSRETVRLWVNRFESHFADCIRSDRPKPSDKWHLDEVVIVINGVNHWLWRAVDANGDVLDILVQRRRNSKAAKRFFKKSVARYGEPRAVVTDELGSYTKPIRNLAPRADHRAHNLRGPAESFNRVLVKRTFWRLRLTGPDPTALSGSGRRSSSHRQRGDGARFDDLADDQRRQFPCDPSA
jgi:putative transposase